MKFKVGDLVRWRSPNFASPTRDGVITSHFDTSSGGRLYMLFHPEIRRQWSAWEDELKLLQEAEGEVQAG